MGLQENIDLFTDPLQASFADAKGEFDNDDASFYDVPDVLVLLFTESLAVNT